MSRERQRRWRPEDGIGPPADETRRQTILVGLGALVGFALIVGAIMAAVVVPNVLKARASAAEQGQVLEYATCTPRRRWQRPSINSPDTVTG